MNAFYLWMLGSALLAAGAAFLVVGFALRTRNVVFRTRTPGRTPTRGRVAPLINVVVRDEPVPERSTV